MSQSIEPNVEMPNDRFSDAFGEFARQTRARRIQKVRAAIHVGHYETARKLDAGLERLLDEACEAEAARVIDRGQPHAFGPTATYMDMIDQGHE